MISPWHQGDQLHRGDRLHQENLWDQQGQEHHVHQQDPKWREVTDASGSQPWLYYHGLASSLCWDKVWDFEGDSWGFQREAKHEEEGDTAMGTGGREPSCGHEYRWM